MGCKGVINGKLFECDVFFRGGECENGIAKDANAFARAILIPEEQLRKDIRSGLNDVGELAKKYQVSSIVVRMRAKELGFRGHGM